MKILSFVVQGQNFDDALTQSLKDIGILTKSIEPWVDAIESALAAGKGVITTIQEGPSLPAEAVLLSKVAGNNVEFFNSRGRQSFYSISNLHTEIVIFQRQ